MNSGDNARSPNKFRKNTVSIEGMDAETSRMPPTMAEKNAEATIISRAPRAALVSLRGPFPGIPRVTPRPPRRRLPMRCRIFA